MTLLSFVPFVAGLFSLLLAAARMLRRELTPAAWCFCAGMTALGIESLVTGLTLRATAADDVLAWLTRAFMMKSFAPAAWLGFSLTYSRGDSRELLTRWIVPLAVVALLPIALALGFQEQLFRITPTGTPGGWVLELGAPAKALNATLLIAFVLIVMNLEQTIRAAAGTMRWRIKFVVLALALIFGTHIFARSQGILFPVQDNALLGVESGALLLGCVLFVLAYARSGLAEIDVYPSRAVLRSSLTVIVVGGYLFAVGVLAQIVRRFGGAELFQLQAFVVLLGMAGLAVLLLSDRARQKVHALTARHFRQAQHDSVQIWTLFSRQLASVQDQAALSAVSARLISETFGVLSVTVWLRDEETGRLVLAASTAQSPQGVEQGTHGHAVSTELTAATASCTDMSSPFDLEDVNEPWGQQLRQLTPRAFLNGGDRLCVALRAAEQSVGLIVLADRVGALAYTVEELELLKCIAQQMTSVLLNLRLAGEVAHAKELEAFRTMSAFFVHDLKNAAASLNLMLTNLPIHFHDPAFRDDALRAVGNTAGRIDNMITRLSTLRERPDFTPVHADLNELVGEALDGVGETPGVELVRELQPLPGIRVDREKIQSVVTNLVLNARDAMGSGGRIQVRTEHRGDRVVLSVQDDGCGMSEAFLKESLFRPFQSTKKKGLGIGLFQARAIVQAHGGGVHVESAPGRGTTFQVSLPVKMKG